jgi:uncharacterized protein (TIGR02147 family)
MIEMKEVFEFKNYKDFIRSKVGPRTSRLGVKGAIAKALRCQPTYVSQVLNGHAHFSLEQGEIISEFFGLTHEQKHYFLLLIQRARSGTKRLEKYFSEQIDQVLAQRLVLTARLGTGNVLSKEDQSIYYSSWNYAAVHMALTIPAFRKPEQISETLGLSRKRVSEVITFLCHAGLAVREGNTYRVGTAQIRLGNDSHNIIKHHTNWRNKAIESLDRESLTDLHYSAVVSLSKSDIVRLKETMLEFISSTVQKIRDSKEEALYCYCMDFFNVLRVDDF